MTALWHAGNFELALEDIQRSLDIFRLDADDSEWWLT
jgi:hypothetical protein